MTVINEKVLIQRIKKGEKTAFTVVFTKYYTDLVMFAYTILKNKDISEEITQEVFVKLWYNRKSLEISSSLRSFLLKSTKNKCIDWLRHQKIHNKYAEIQLNNNLLFHNETENYLLYSELENILNKSIRELPEKINEAYCLNRFEGLTYQEIAEKLNVSVRTVEVRVSKALNLLRDKLKQYIQ